MPSDPAFVVRALRACRDVLINRVQSNVKPFGEIYVLTDNITKAIDALADRLSGEDGYFRIGGSYAGESERAARREKEARERGDIPWDG